MTIEPANWSEAERAAFYAKRESRNRALGVLLFSLVALFFGITVVRMTGPDAKRPGMVPASVMPPAASPSP